VWFADPMPAMPSDLRVAYPHVAHLTKIDREHDDEIVIRREFEAIVIQAKHRMVHDGRFKLIYVPSRTGVRWMLFDTVDDPQEVREVSGLYPDDVDRLRAELWKWMLADPLMRRCGDQLISRDVFQGKPNEPQRSVGLTDGELAVGIQRMRP
jgi:hypothetical protein